MRRVLLVLLTLVVGLAGGLALAVAVDLQTFPGVDATRTSAEPAATATVTATATATATATVTASPSASSAAQATEPAASSPAATSAAPTISQAPAAAVVLRVTADGSHLVRTASGSVSCYLLDYFGDRSVECVPRDKSFDDPKRPGSCEYDWAPQFTLTSRATYGVCRSDANDRDSTTVLRPGQGAVNGPLTCVASDRETVECRNSATEHGFVVSPASYRLF
jgi:hypothetical protein